MASARRKKDGEGKRYPLNMRTTKEVRDLLERAAARSGRSLVQEVEYRIESSFRDDRWLKGIGGANAELVVRAVLHFLGLVQARAREGKRDTEIADAVSRGIGLIADCVLKDRRISKDRRTALLLMDKNDSEREITSIALSILEALGFADKSQPEEAPSGSNR